MSGNSNANNSSASAGLPPDVRSYKAVARDPNQPEPEHKRPRVFLHRPAEASDPSIEEEARRNVSVVEAAKTIQLEDFTKVHQKPCIRDAFLPSISAGAVVGAGRFVMGASVLTACNWASGSFIGVSVVVYNFCQRRRQLEKDGIRRAVRVLDQKQAMKDAENNATAPLAAPQGQKESVSFWSTFKFW